MVLAIGALHLEVDNGMPVRAATLHRLDDAPLDGGKVVAWNRAADDPVDEPNPPPRSMGLTRAVRRRTGHGPGLLLHLALSLYWRPDRLAVGDPDLGGFDRDAELAGQPLDRHLHLSVTAPM